MYIEYLNTWTSIRWTSQTSLGLFILNPSEFYVRRDKFNMPYTTGDVKYKNRDRFIVFDIKWTQL